MNVLDINVDYLVPYENNPRVNDDAAEKLAKVIAEYGWQQPIVTDKNYVIIAGHTRYKAAQILGLKSVPVVIADNLSEEQVKAFRIIDNKVAEFSGWDWEKLARELDSIEGIDMSDFDFNLPEETNIDEFWSTPTEETAAKEPKTVTCPHCGEVFEL